RRLPRPRRGAGTRAGLGRRGALGRLYTLRGAGLASGPMRTHARGFWGAAAAAVVLLPLIAGCGNDDGDDGGEGAEEGGGTLTIYSGREEELIGPLFEDFTEETGIEVDVRYGDSADLALLIEEEGDNTPADV